MPGSVVDVFRRLKMDGGRAAQHSGKHAVVGDRWREGGREGGRGVGWRLPALRLASWLL